MPKRAEHQPVEFIMPLNMNGLQGRMLVMPKPGRKSREILFIYGHHSSLERWWELIKVLHRSGSVTAPDLPGFGGMQSIYRINQAPTLDNLADYLAAFVRLRYKHKRFSIVGMGFGFVVVTRMLERYPDIVKKVDIVVSLVGFSHHNDFKFSQQQQLLYKNSARVCSWRFPAWLLQHTVFRPWMMRRFYYLGQSTQQRFRDLDLDIFHESIEDEIALWQLTDVRTHMATNVAMLNLDNCRSKVELPLWHVSIPRDRYFDKHRVEQHLQVIFSDVQWLEARFSKQSNELLNEHKNVSALIPYKLRQRFTGG
jgi:pimeloyl-ACP methyl ester carboxylesterase